MISAIRGGMDQGNQQAGICKRLMHFILGPFGSPPPQLPGLSDGVAGVARAVVEIPVHVEESGGGDLVFPTPKELPPPRPPALADASAEGGKGDSVKVEPGAGAAGLPAGKVQRKGTRKVSIKGAVSEERRDEESKEKKLATKAASKKNLKSSAATINERSRDYIEKSRKSFEK